MEQNWPIRLFSKSVLKQRKFQEVTALLGPVDGLRCLDIGGDSGVISYLLRQRGGAWASADLDARSVESIRQLVGSEVYQLSADRLPFSTNQFDRVAIVDYLEHIHNDATFIDELYRVVRPGGEIVINVPIGQAGLMRSIRLRLGQTDEKHGHVRPGYTLQALRRLLGDCFTVESAHTYSRFFSELIDACMVFAVSRLKKEDKKQSSKGLFVTGQDLRAYAKLFKVYSFIYPFVWLTSKLDHLLFFTNGYMLIVRACSNKPA